MDDAWLSIIVALIASSPGWIGQIIQLRKSKGDMDMSAAAVAEKLTDIATNLMVPLEAKNKELVSENAGLKKDVADLRKQLAKVAEKTDVRLAKALIKSEDLQRQLDDCMRKFGDINGNR